MDKRFVASMILKTIALILFLISLIVNFATVMGNSISDTSNAVVFLTLLFGWILYGIDKIFVDNEEED
jgi:hypothetical protein